MGSKVAIIYFSATGNTEAGGAGRDGGGGGRGRGRGSS